jgi:hypothetical protein
MCKSTNEFVYIIFGEDEDILGLLASEFLDEGLDEWLDTCAEVGGDLGLLLLHFRFCYIFFWKSFGIGKGNK